PLRYAATRTRSDLPVRRYPRVRRSEVVYLSARHDPRLPGDADAAGIRLRQPSGHEIMRLRDFVLCLSLNGAGALARVGLRHGATVLAQLQRPGLASLPCWARVVCDR